MFSPITDEDIQRVEQMLLPVGQQFDQQRRDIIRCQHSVDVNACPGSGKTTVMLAKLLLLTKQMPLKNNQGICVLTHTNVGINEIKEKLGLSDTALFKYPNHFGTIQSFVNKFLGIPGYSAMFPGQRPSVIDQEWYNNLIAKRYSSWQGAGKIWISHQSDPISLLQSYRFNSSFDNLLKSLNGAPVFNNPGNALNDILNFKKRILRDGILSYDDAYVLAEYYLLKHPCIKEVIKKRFPLVIIDEMQDTDTHQLSLLNQIFNPDTTVLQRIGDYNQAIFNRVSSQSVWSTGQQVLPLTGSKRFSEQIATQIDRICLTPRNMVGNANIQNIQPTIILFSQANILQVIPHFSNKLIELNITTLSEKPCKAVGWVKEKEAEPGQVRNCIKSYWQNYSVVNKVSKTEFENMIEYFSVPDTETIQMKGVGYFWDKMLLMLLKLLRIVQVKSPSGSFYSRTSLTVKLKSHSDVYDELKSGMINWIREVQKGNDTSAEMRNFITQHFLPIFQIQPNAELNSFLNNQNLGVQVNQANAVNSGNIYIHTYDGVVPEHEGKHVPVHINTIHSVKGETHAATLCLETFYYGDDIKRILRYLKIAQGAPLPAQQVRMIETLKMTYVAISRPVHFLCIAIRNEDITANDITQLEAAGWAVDTSLTN